MLALRTQSGIEGGSRHGSRRLSGRSLQPNRRDGRIERGVSASTSWTGAWQGPGSEHAGPRLDVTHRVSWVRWSRGLCRALTPSRLEGPAVSRPSPVGPRLLHARPQEAVPVGGPWRAGRKRPVQQHRKPWPLERTRTYRPWTEGVDYPSRRQRLAGKAAWKWHARLGGPPHTLGPLHRRGWWGQRRH